MNRFAAEIKRSIWAQQVDVMVAEDIDSNQYRRVASSAANTQPLLRERKIPRADGWTTWLARKKTDAQAGVVLSVAPTGQAGLVPVNAAHLVERFSERQERLLIEPIDPIPVETARLDINEARCRLIIGIQLRGTTEVAPGSCPGVLWASYAHPPFDVRQDNAIANERRTFFLRHAFRMAQVSAWITATLQSKLIAYQQLNRYFNHGGPADSVDGIRRRAETVHRSNGGARTDLDELLALSRHLKNNWIATKDTSIITSSTVALQEELGRDVYSDNLRPVVEEAWAVAKILSGGNAGKKALLNTIPEDARVTTSFPHLSELCTQIMCNSLKWGKSNGSNDVTVGASLEGPKSDGSVRFRISDQGPGLPGWILTDLKEGRLVTNRPSVEKMLGLPFIWRLANALSLQQLEVDSKATGLSWTLTLNG